MKWDEVPIPLEDCTAYYIDDENVTNTSARVDRLLVKYMNAFADGKVSAGSEIVIRKSGSLSKTVTVGVDVSIRGENGAVLDTFDPASFIVTNGTLTVQGIGFKGYSVDANRENLEVEGYVGNALFVVNGGELVISNGVSVSDMIGTNKYSGAVQVLSGTATLGPGITISDCAFSGVGNGAGVYVGKGATLNFFGGTITGCEATGNGGAIYLYKNAALNLKGEIFISGNTKYGGGSSANNIYAFGAGSTISVVGPISGEIGVSYGSTAGVSNEPGGEFAMVASSLSDKDKAGVGRGMAAFVNDVNPQLRATFAADSQLSSLIWTEDSVAAGTVPDDLIGFAYARVVEPDATTNYFWSVSDAFNAVDTDGSSVEMLQSDNFDGELTVANLEVRLASALDGGIASLTGGTFRVSGSLALVDVQISGENLFDVDGGMLLLDGAVASEVGCVGGSSADANMFAKVRCDLSYESLTNSAANFRNAEIDAYGVAVTNASAGTAVVWSRAIASDGTFTGEDGVVWGCVGDIPVYEIAVVPVPIAFSAIVLDEVSGAWNLTLTNLVRGCWYSLYSTNSLTGGFVVGEGVVEPVTNFQAEADGEFIFTQESAGGAMFWKAVAEPGVIIQ